MSNMSYCRWQNTVSDLQDCAENIYDTDLSDKERRARIRLLKLAWDMVSDFVEDGELDVEMLEDLQPVEEERSLEDAW